MSVMYLFFCDWHHPSFQQTAKDETAYTQVSDKPDDSSQTATTQPKRNGSYIAMSPVEAQKCWSLFCLPRLRKGVREQHMGVVLQWVGLTHSGHIFCYPRGGGGGWTQAPVNADTAVLTEHSPAPAPAPSVPPAPGKQTFLPTNLLVGPNMSGTQTGSARTNISFCTDAWNTTTSLGHLKRALNSPKLPWLSLIFPVHQCWEKKTRT